LNFEKIIREENGEVETAGFGVLWERYILV
jgi:hypothetical protein